MQLSEDELRRPINGHEEVELALLSANLGNVEVEVADRITLEGFFSDLVTGDLRQTADRVAFKAPMQDTASDAASSPARHRGSRPAQQCMLAEGDDDGFLLTIALSSARFRPIHLHNPFTPLATVLCSAHTAPLFLQPSSLIHHRLLHLYLPYPPSIYLQPSASQVRSQLREELAETRQVLPN